MAVVHVPAKVRYECDAGCGNQLTEEEADVSMHPRIVEHPMPKGWVKHGVLVGGETRTDEAWAPSLYCPKCAEKIDRAIQIERAKISEMFGG
jgi:hypothetical protein|tara:strand:- start:46 stop:321 length:276 start_codon:yes stop_codon:yes gene_type:complete